MTEQENKDRLGERKKQFQARVIRRLNGEEIPEEETEEEKRSALGQLRGHGKPAKVRVQLLKTLLSISYFLSLFSLICDLMKTRIGLVGSQKMLKASLFNPGWELEGWSRQARWSRCAAAVWVWGQAASEVTQFPG